MSPLQESDRRFMARALMLARRARHLCRPNPMVGAVIVRNGRILGEGWHQLAGQAHAEIEALGGCTEDPRGATLYVTLEPCCHTGKRTPPCVPAILQAGFARVVVATLDPTPLVSGRGVAALVGAGVIVDVGLLEREARELNEAFAFQILTGRPFTTLKLAMTLDGRIADGSGRSKWITADQSRLEVQRLRAQMDAILVGKTTAESDDPSLNVRLRGYRGPQPLRVVMANKGRLSWDLRILTEDPGRTHVFTSPDAGAKDLAHLRKLGVQVHSDGTAPATVVETLAALGVQRLLVEGGGRTAGAFLDAGLVQRVWLFYAPLLLGAQDARPAVASPPGRSLDDAWKLARMRLRRLGPDWLISGYVEDPLVLWERSASGTALPAEPKQQREA